jgi:hypothetical protein
MKNRYLKYLLSYIGIGLLSFIGTLLIIAMSGSLYVREKGAATIDPFFV